MPPVQTKSLPAKGRWYDFASIKAASDFYNAPKPISAVYTLYTLALAALRF